MILVSIVLTFLVCHTFRLVIQAYEVTHPSHSTEEHHGFCHAQGRSVSKCTSVFNTQSTIKSHLCHLPSRDAVAGLRELTLPT